MDNILLVSDLDGTLLDEKGELSPINKQAILSFRKKGGVFTIATSQSEHALLPLLDEIPLLFPLILHHGALIFDPQERKALKTKYMALSPFLLKKLIKYVRENPISILFFIGSDVYTIRRDSNIQALEERMNCQTKLLEKSADFSKLIRIFIFSSYPNLLDQVKKSIFHYNIECEAYFTHQNSLEILPLNVNKGKALSKIIQHYSLETREIYSVGNNITDFSLFELSDRSYILNNCHPRLKLEKSVTPVPNDSHAIAHIVEDIQKERHLLTS